MAQEEASMSDSFGDETSDLLERLGLVLDNPSHSPLKYFDRTKEHNNFFQAIFTSLESNMAKAIQEQLKPPFGGRYIPPSLSQLQELANYIDEDIPTFAPTQLLLFNLLLISEDQKSVVIGEIKHEMTKLVFALLKARKAFLKECGEKISWLQNAKEFRLLFGCEVLSQQVVDRCKKEKCVFVHPTTYGYQIDDFSQTKL